MSDDFLILHGEDDAIDVRIMEDILEKMDYKGTYKNIALGQDVVDYLFYRGAYSDEQHPLPNLIILDIGLPGCTGKEILASIRAGEMTQSIPVIMSSGSSSLRDYQECIRLGCNAYIQKTTDFENFSHVFTLFLEGWSKISQQDLF